MNAINGLGWFLVANWVLLCIPVVFFYFYLQHQHWAVIMSLVYTGVMTINGLGHNLATLASGKYFDGYAGGYTSAGLMLVGLSSMYLILKELKTKGVWMPEMDEVLGMALSENNQLASKPVNPYTIGGGFLGYCQCQGWIVIMGKGRNARYYLADKGAEKLKQFGIEV